MAEKQAPVTFTSRYNTLTVVIRSAAPEFHGPWRRVNPGKRARFENGVLVTNDPEVIEALRKHPGYGRDFHEVRNEAVARALSATG